MTERPRAKLDGAVLQSRLRTYSPRSTSYTRRSPKHHSTSLLISDVAKKVPKLREQPNAAAPEISYTPLNQSPTKSDYSQPKALEVTKKHSLLLNIRSVLKNPFKNPRTSWENKMPVVLCGLALIVFITGLLVSLNGFRVNHNVSAEVSALSSKKNSGPDPAPSTTRITPSEIANYTVPPNSPRYIIIPKLGVKARVLSVGLNAQGNLKTPSNVYDTAWYNQSAEPGRGGATLIDGHVSSWTTHGVFYGISTLVPGDIIEIQRGDNTVFTYKVVKDQVYQANNVDMTSALTPAVAGVPGLNLISCTGDVIPGTSQFNERVIVFAEQISS